jgi:hypothetical protein
VSIYLVKIKFLVENGANIQANKNEALEITAENDHLEVIKFSEENATLTI